MQSVYFGKHCVACCQNYLYFEATLYVWGDIERFHCFALHQTLRPYLGREKSFVVANSACLIGRGSETSTFSQPPFLPLLTTPHRGSHYQLISWYQDTPKSFDIMALITDLPPEILTEIIALVHLKTQEEVGDATQHTGEFTRINQDIAIYRRALVSTGSYTAGLHSRNFWDRETALMNSSAQVILGSLPALNLTCRYLHGLVSQIMYKHVELHTTPFLTGNILIDFFKHQSRSMQRLISGFLRDPLLATYVRTLALKFGAHISHICEQGQTSSVLDQQLFDAAEIEYLAQAHDFEGLQTLLSTRPVHRNASTLFTLLPNLRSLMLDFTHTSSPTGIHHDNTQNILSWLVRSPGLQDITEFSLLLDDEYEMEFDDILCIFGLPAIHTIYLRNVTCVDPLPNQTEQLSGTSTLKELFMDGCLFSEGAWELLAAIPAALERFTFGYGGNSEVAEEACSTKALISHLSHQSESLRAVIIRGCIFDREDQYMTNTIISNALVGFDNLEELSLPFTVLFRTWDSSDRWKLHEVVPKHLKKLELYVYDEAHAESWAQVVKDFLQAKDTVCPRLEEVWIEYWAHSIEGMQDNDDDLPISQAMHRAQLKESRERAIRDLTQVGANKEVKVDVLVDEYMSRFDDDDDSDMNTDAFEELDDEMFYHLESMGDEDGVDEGDTEDEMMDSEDEIMYGVDDDDDDDE